jgi:hypothetical protein
MVNGTFPLGHHPENIAGLPRQGGRFLPRAQPGIFINPLMLLYFFIWHAPCFVVDARPAAWESRRAP